MPKTPSYGIDQNQELPFIDKYWGRVPKMLHYIPEDYICKANPEYIYLINAIINDEIDKENISDELYFELADFINRMCNPCAMDGEDRALYRAYSGLEPCPKPSIYGICDDVMCCDTIIIGCVDAIDCINGGIGGDIEAIQNRRRECRKHQV